MEGIIRFLPSMEYKNCYAHTAREACYCGNVQRLDEICRKHTLNIFGYVFHLNYGWQLSGFLLIAFNRGHLEIVKLLMEKYSVKLPSSNLVLEYIIRDIYDKEYFPLVDYLI